MDYNKFHADNAMQHQPVKDKSVLVVGCNSGKDCSYFVEAGARIVHGLDVDKTIGADYQHPNVTYFRESAEKMSLPSNLYDLVYCFATMEHIPDIEAAFNEMARVTCPDGIIYCLASPLWNSRGDHHLSHYFENEPWIHPRKSQQEVLDYLNEHNVQIAPANGSRETVTSYMFDPVNFNMTESSRYLHVCNNLQNFTPIRHELDLDTADLLPDDIRDELGEKEYSPEELLAVTHIFIARKNCT